MRPFFRFFRDVVEKFSKSREIIPPEEQPMDIGDIEEYEPEQQADMWKDAMLERHGAGRFSYIQLTNVLRTMEYLGDDVEIMYVAPGTNLSFEAIIVHPEYGQIIIAGSLPSGTEWTEELQRRYFSSAVGRVRDDIENPSKLLREGILAVNWYMNSYSRII